MCHGSSTHPPVCPKQTGTHPPAPSGCVRTHPGVRVPSECWRRWTARKRVRDPVSFSSAAVRHCRPFILAPVLRSAPVRSKRTGTRPPAPWRARSRPPGRTHPSGVLTSPDRRERACGPFPSGEPPLPITRKSLGLPRAPVLRCTRRSAQSGPGRARPPLGGCVRTHPVGRVPPRCRCQRTARKRAGGPFPSAGPPTDPASGEPRPSPPRPSASCCPGCRNRTGTAGNPSCRFPTSGAATGRRNTR